MKKFILITGADGYIGRNLLKIFLLDKKYLIYALTKKKKKNINNIKYIKGNLKTNIFNKISKIDIIIHCASKGVYKKETKANIFKTNYFDSLNFFKRAYKANIINWIILGTSGEYGLVKKGSMSIKTKLKPLNDYGKSKVKFFNSLKKNKNFSLASIIYLRLFHVFGKDESKDRLYPSFINAIKLKTDFKMTIGAEIRDFIHINQAVKLIKKNINNFNLKKKPFFKVGHVATGKPTTVLNFIKKIRRKKKSKIKLLVGKSSKINIYHTMYSDKKSLI
jgi:UDP-glucose 4-epimerase